MIITRRLAALAVALAASAAHADSLRFCDRGPAADAVQQDRRLRFAAIVKDELDRSGAPAALVARSGLDLARFGQRYSHAGISLRDGQTRWSVRQLYYACDERRPRLYDQGMAGFVLGTEDAALGYVSIVVLPGPEAASLAATALDTPRALSLLGARYSANAYPFSEAYQNCNQWVMELLALAWGAPVAAAPVRTQAQAWLRDARYAPHAFVLGSPLWMVLGLAVPWIHHGDHPPEDVAAGTYRVSMPSSIEEFVHERVAGAQRIELCQRDREVVIRHGWTSIADGCVAAGADRVVTLD